MSSVHQEERSDQRDDPGLEQTNANPWSDLDSAVRLVRDGFRQGSRLALGSPAFVGLILTVATWTTIARELQPQDGLDLSYWASLQRAFTHSFAFGPRFVFTYGPLGFLGLPVPFFGLPAVLSFIFLTGVRVSVGAVVYRSLRESLPAFAAILLAYVVMVLTSEVLPVEMLAPLGLAWAARSVDLSPGYRVTASFGLAGLMTGLASLIKVSIAIPLVVVFVLAWLLRRQRQRIEIVWYVAASIGSFVLAWIATGNSLFLIPSWLRLGYEFVSGYSAMAIESPGRLYLYWLAAAVVLLVLALAIHREGPSESNWRRLAWVVMTGVVLEALFRESFVRHDLHDLLFFAAAPVVLAAVARPGPSSIRQSLPALMVTACLFELVALGAAPDILARPVTSAHRWVSEAKTLLVPADRHQLQAAGRAAMQESFHIPDAWLQEFRGQKVLAFPLGQPIGWAYPYIPWENLPTLQAYAAYTPALDNADASYFKSSRAPTWVLQQSLGIDGRNPVWEAPNTQLALRCRYELVGSSSYFVLLHRVPNMCSSPIGEGTIHTRLGTTVDVPEVPTGSAVAFTADTSSSIVGSVADLAFKGATYSVKVNDKIVYRFVTGTGSSLHLLTFPLDSGTALALPAVTRLEVTSNDRWASSSDVTVRFFEIPLSRS